SSILSGVVKSHHNTGTHTFRGEAWRRETERAPREWVGLPETAKRRLAGERPFFGKVRRQEDHTTLSVPIGNLCSEMLVVQSVQNWRLRPVTHSLEGAWERCVLCSE